MRRFLLSVAVVVVLASVVGAQDFPPALVVVEPARMVEFHDQITLIGRTSAIAESRIVAEVSGKVLAIDTPEGRWLEAGGILVQIDPRRITLALAAKEAETKQAKASAELAEKDLGRAQDMHNQDLLAESGYDANIAEQIRAIERYYQLEAERGQLLLDRSNCAIRAPYSGYTIRQLVQIGEWVNPGTAVYEFVDLSVIKVVVDLPERRFGQVEIGSPVEITTSGDNGVTVIGIVSGIAPRASQTTHTFPVIVKVDNAEGLLGGGMLVRATLSTKNKFMSLAVSKDALVRQGNQTIVYIVVDGKAAPITVITSSSAGTLVAVSAEGLEEGAPVVVRGNERIFPGSPVQVPGAAPGEDTSEEADTGESQGSH